MPNFAISLIVFPIYNSVKIILMQNWILIYHFYRSWSENHVLIYGDWLFRRGIHKMIHNWRCDATGKFLLIKSNTSKEWHLLFGGKIHHIDTFDCDWILLLIIIICFIQSERQLLDISGIECQSNQSSERI